MTSEVSLSATGDLATEDVDKLLNGVYAKLRHPNGIGYFAIMNTEIMGDNYKPVKFQWYQVQNFYEHNVPSDDILLGYFYSGYYGGVDRANTVLKTPTATKNQRGIAKYCRALSLLRLTDMYDRIPLTDETYDGNPIAPSSKAEVLKFIIEDLKFAKENCTKFATTDRENAQKVPSSEAAAALLARVYRISGDIASAGKEAEELIKSGKFSLAPNPIERTDEVIFMFKGNKTEGVGSWGWIMSHEARAWNCFAAADDLTALVKDTDTRKVLFDFENKDANNGYIYSKKYRIDYTSDLLVSRIAEMYLISAEAGNNNRLSELQKVRKSSLTLKQERRLEMSFEWTRWEDLKLEGETYVLPYPTKAKNANPLLK